MYRFFVILAAAAAFWTISLSCSVAQDTNHDQSRSLMQKVPADIYAGDSSDLRKMTRPPWSML